MEHQHLDAGVCRIKGYIPPVGDRAITTSLPPDKLESLLPILEYLATMVRDQTSIERTDLEILLLGSGVDGEWAMDELLLWTTILARARDVPDPTRRQTVHRALLLRGIPDAPAMLALATVAAATPPPAPTPTLGVSVDRIDFGTLSSGQGAQAEFTVEGGPGRLVVNSDALQIQPEVFGATPTVIQVRVEGLPGGMLLSSIAVLTSSENRDLPVTARWAALPESQGGDRASTGAAPPPASPPTPISATPTAGPLLPPNQIGSILQQLRGLIAARTYLSYGQVEQVLVAVGISVSDERVDEVKIWADILQQAHDAALPQKTAEAVTQLVARGIPRTLAEQALAPAGVNTTTGTAPVTGTGKAGTTPVRGIRKPKTSTGTASVIPPLRRPSLSRLVVALDGSGTHTDLAQALRDSAPHATIQLRAGTHVLATGVEILEPVTIEGQGRTTTRVVLSQGSFALRYRGSGSFGLKKVTVERASTQTAADIVTVHSGRVDIEDCAFYSGRHDSAVEGAGLLLTGAATGTVTTCEASDNAHGFLLTGQTSVTITGCTAVSNQKDGISTRQDAQPLLGGNTCRLNQRNGITFSGTAGGKVRNNTCEQNHANGIEITEEAKPILDSNRCRLNQGNGMSLSGMSTGGGRNNICTENQKHGILTDGEATPVLGSNTCRLNKFSGIAFLGTSGGEALDNICDENQGCGISVKQSARPMLRKNTCRRNRLSGIEFSDTSAGEARNNICEENQGDGILLAGETKCLLDNSQCRLNKQNGISVAHTAKATLTNNRCHNNRLNDIADSLSQVKPQATSTAVNSSQTRGCLVVALDGSGTHANLADALRDAPPHATIQLRPGTHALSTGIEILQPVTIEGHGNTDTRVKFSTGSFGLRYLGTGSFCLKRLGLYSLTSGKADIVTVQSGEAKITDCWFRGGGSGGQLSAGAIGAGLVVGSAVTGTVTACEANDNIHGFVVAGESSVRVTGCTATSNQKNGFLVCDQAKPIIDGNTCRRNQRGILFSGRSTGEACGNTCEENTDVGIRVKDSAHPVLKDNTCCGNKRAGIRFSGASAGEVQGNICEENGLNSIQIGGSANPILRNKEATQNPQRRVAKLGTRFKAFVMDCFLLCILILLSVAIVALFVGGIGSIIWSGHPRWPADWLWLLIIAAIPFLYFRANRQSGGSVGQEEELRIVSLDGSLPSVREWLVRSFVKIAQIYGLLFIIIRSPLLGIPTAILLFLPLLRMGHRAWHDIASGTEIVRVEK